MATGQACTELSDVGGMVSGMTRPGTTVALARPGRRRVAQLAGPPPGGPAPDTAAVELLIEHDIWPRRRDFLDAAVHVDEDGVCTGSTSGRAATSTTGATSTGVRRRSGPCSTLPCLGAMIGIG
jgi:hypothetical protein